jgi:hypothetical protein
MADKKTRGTKLKCQNEECARPFYDLDVAQPECPTCGTAFDHEAAKEPASPASSYRRGRQAPVFEIVAPEEPVSETDDDSDSDEAGASDQILDIDEDDSDDGSMPGPKEQRSSD